jgi:glucan 1,3-beta-glucosidase
MTASDFKCAVGHQDAELDVAMGWGSSQNAKALLEKHWDDFITESDFQYLASIGINTVRLPIGFWNLPGSEFKSGTPFEGTGDAFAGSWARIVRAINWANTYGIGVLVDLHGAAGSQNGQVSIRFCGVYETN